MLEYGPGPSDWLPFTPLLGRSCLSLTVRGEVSSHTLNNLAIREFDEWELAQEVSEPMNLETRIPTLACGAFLSHFFLEFQFPDL